LALIVAGITIAVVKGIKAGGDDDDWGRFHFSLDSLVPTRRFYTGNADTFKGGETLPPGCAGGLNGTTNVTLPRVTRSGTRWLWQVFFAFLETDGLDGHTGPFGEFTDALRANVMGRGADFT